MRDLAHHIAEVPAAQALFFLFERVVADDAYRGEGFDDLVSRSVEDNATMRSAARYAF
jgi:hypothetical protein